MKIQNALVSNIFDRSQRYFAHVTTVTLSWRVQNILVIGRVYFTLECFEFSSNFEFDRNMLSGTGSWSCIYNGYNSVIIAYADLLAPKSASPSASTVLSTKLEILFSFQAFFINILIDFLLIILYDAVRCCALWGLKDSSESFRFIHFTQSLQ